MLPSSLPFISLPTQQSPLRVNSVARLPLPTQLVRSSTATLLPWRPSRVGWDHRKTRDENKLSYFIPFIDE